MADIVISTGPVDFAYEVVDTIFAIDSSSAGFLSSVDPDKAFDGVKKQLREKCRALRGDAVAFCQFEYRNALADGFLGKKQALEIFAYGTAVKRK
jgi:hypothetical protein